MPCDSVILNSVDMPKMHPGLAAAALKGLKGLEVTYQDNERTLFTLGGESYSLDGGELRGLSGQSTKQVGKVADQLKQGYSIQVVRMRAAANGWTVKQLGSNRFQVIKK